MTFMNKDMGILFNKLIVVGTVKVEVAVVASMQTRCCNSPCVTALIYTRVAIHTLLWS